MRLCFAALLVFCCGISEAAIKFVKTYKYMNVTLRKEFFLSNASVLSTKLLPQKKEYYGIDLLFVADYTLYRWYYGMTSNEDAAYYYVNEYLHAIFEQMRTIYEHTAFPFGKLHFRLVKTIIITRALDCPLIQPIDMKVEEKVRNVTVEQLYAEANTTKNGPEFNVAIALDRFKAWKLKYSDLMPPHDHTMLFTKQNLKGRFDDGTSVGISGVNQICSGPSSSSVIEDSGGMMSAMTAAHELGHNLGSGHDLDDGTYCSPQFLHIMSPSTPRDNDYTYFSNTRKFSPCSVANITRNIIKNGHCLKKKNRIDIHNKVSSLPFEKLAGERFTATQQCQMAFGKTYALCMKPEYANLHGNSCQRIWCKDRSQKWEADCGTGSFFPPFDGTKCGSKKWCMSGECVDNPKLLEDCHDTNKAFCEKYSKTKLRKLCKSRDFSDVCCRSCHKTRSKEIRWD